MNPDAPNSTHDESVMEVEAESDNTAQSDEPDCADSSRIRDNTEVRVRRAAAIKAREKIAEWTRLLFILLK